MKETLENLIKAFIGESQARNRYTYYAKVAQKEGFEQIAGIFLETADHEKEHAKRLFEHIQDLKEEDEINVTATAPLVYKSTKENLVASIAGEHYENTEMYPSFTRKAEEEGLPAIASRLKSIAKSEEHHEERYKKLLEQVEKGSVFKKEEEVDWVCRKCGYPHKSKEAPEKCPACNHERSFYQIKCEEY